jgi:predicted phage-related endonuclease
MGASFDYEIVGLRMASQELAQHFIEHGTGIAEVKCVDYLIFRDQWLRDDGTIEAPDHIEVQLQHQLHVSGYKWGAIFVLVSGHTPYVLIREYDADAGVGIENGIRAFWESIRLNQEPPPDLDTDAEFYCKLHGYAEPNKLYDGRGNERLAKACLDYKFHADVERQAEANKKAARATIYELIGDAEYALVDGYKVWAGLVGPAHIPAQDRAGYRSIKVTPKKGQQ